MIKVIATGTIADKTLRYHTTESGKQKVEFRLFDGKLHHTIVAWEETSKVAVAEGDYVFIEGRLGYRSYDNKEGNKVWVTEVTAATIENLSSKPVEVPDDLGF